MRQRPNPAPLDGLSFKNSPGIFTVSPKPPRLNAPDDRRSLRLALVDGVRTLIHNGLSLLGVNAPTEM